MIIKKLRIYICIIFILLVSVTVILVGYITNESPTFEKGITDNSVQKLETHINSIKDGLPFAVNRVKEWRKDLYLDYISISFKDEKQISDRKGIISYNFYGKNVKNGLDATAEVKIDMSNNSIIRFMSSYGTSKVLLGGGNEIKIENWEIDIGDAIETAMKIIGKENILKQEKPNIIIRCWEKSWEVAVLSNEKPPVDDYYIELNPETGEIITSRSQK